MQSRVKVADRPRIGWLSVVNWSAAVMITSVYRSKGQGQEIDLLGQKAKLSRRRQNNRDSGMYCQEQEKICQDKKRSVTSKEHKGTLHSGRINDPALALRFAVRKDRVVSQASPKREEVASDHHKFPPPKTAWSGSSVGAAQILR